MSRVDISLYGDRARHYREMKEALEEEVGHDLSWPNALDRMVESDRFP